VRGGTGGLIRRRHVFFVEGYDPQGADGYYRMFAREWKRFGPTWGVRGDLGKPEIDSEEFAHWTIETAAPNWQVAVRYEFLRLEGPIRRNITRPLLVQIPQALWWMVTDVATGTMFRTLRAAWRFALHLMVIQGLLVAWIILAAAAGTIVGRGAARLLDLPVWAAALFGLVTAVGCFQALVPLARRWLVIQVSNCWPHVRAFARGAPSAFDPYAEACARRVVEAARAAEVDEIVLVSHSAGCAISPVVMARAFAIDPDLGRQGPAIVMVTLGSLMPGFALHPAAERLRAAMRVIAREPSLFWLDCQARKDPMNFWEFDPIAGSGIDVGGERRNPAVWVVRVRDMLTDDVYGRLRSNYFRMHYQFIMGNNRRAEYDYNLLISGPLPVREYARLRARIPHSFAADGAFLGETSAPCAAINQ
jgi:hypothetical protein